DRVHVVLPQVERCQPKYETDHAGRGRPSHHYNRKLNVVERCFGWLKKFRRFSTRYEKLAGSFAAFIKLAFCLRYLGELLADKKTHFDNTA
ncbi:transposase, partial [Aeromonas salmonicida]|uniref:transposase n=1 Tax=Aeromonas salmonicida TaxID=645 RepID=UPI00286B809D